MTANISYEDVGAEAGPTGRLWSERLLWGVAATLLSAVMSISLFTGVAQLAALETEANDILRVNLAPRAEAQDPRISIVALNEKTLAQFPYRSPIDRGLLAGLMDALREAGARAVLLDVIFDQSTEPEKDEALIAAIRRFEGPVVAAWGDHRSGFIESQSLYIKEFAERAGLELGFANIVYDDDGVVRRFTTRLPGVEKLSMSGVMAQELTGETPLVDGLIDWRLPRAANVTLFQQLPANAVLSLSARAATKVHVDRAMRDRIVFVGADLEQRDRH
ncbi:MAG: CHASE2 domain-containing protein, partial [Pseudomonadota bacterium]